MLKQPLQTSITIDNLDFEDIQIEEDLHIAISVKDFKAIVAHAETIKTSVTAAYSVPRRPMQLTYQENGMQCFFTLMTTGDCQGASVTPAPVGQQTPSHIPLQPRPRDGVTARVQVTTSVNSMPPPSQPASRSFIREPPRQRVQRPSPPPPRSRIDPESLFIPTDEDEDRHWGERNYDEEDTVGWSASAVRVRILSCSD